MCLSMNAPTLACWLVLPRRDTGRITRAGHVPRAANVTVTTDYEKAIRRKARVFAGVCVRMVD